MCILITLDIMPMQGRRYFFPPMADDKTQENRSHPRSRLILTMDRENIDLHLLFPVRLFQKRVRMIDEDDVCSLRSIQNQLLYHSPAKNRHSRGAAEFSRILEREKEREREEKRGKERAKEEKESTDPRVSSSIAPDMEVRADEIEILLVSLSILPHLCLLVRSVEIALEPLVASSYL
jgi:hypothetical protein